MITDNCRLEMVFKKGKDNYMYGKKGKNCPNYGRKKSEEELTKLRQRFKGEKNPMYGKKGILSPHYGKKHSNETIQKMIDIKLGVNNPLWKGDNVGYIALHAWVKRHLPKSEKCHMCKEKPPRDLANISGKYLRDLDDWQWLCRKCHMLSDNRILNLKQFKTVKI